MEYQSFFMLLKEYQMNNGAFCCANPLQVFGFAMIKKELKNYYLVVQSNKEVKSGFVVCEDNVIKFQTSSKNTKLKLDFVPNLDKIVVIFPDEQLFATKVSTENCQMALEKINNKQEKDIYQKIFGNVYKTYFFDTIKPKLAKLFELGENTDDFASLGGKWTKLFVRGKEKVFGVIYKNNFAYAIAVGELHQGGNKVANLLQFAGKFYNMVFMSAEDGKYLQFSSGTLC